MRLTLLTCAALLSVACQKTVIEGSGVVVVVLVDPKVKADCIGVAAVKASGGTEQLSTLATRDAHLEFGVGSGPGLDGEISVVARGFLGAACSTPGVLNAQSRPGTLTFKEGTAAQKLTLTLDGALDDDDGDGYRAASKGGIDCDPGNGAINPGEVELCSDGIDNDCSGLADCADRAGCEGHACDDHDPCSTGETCTNALCRPAQTPCSTPPGSCYAALGACSAGGTCVYPVLTGSACDGGTCRSDGTCGPGESICDDHLDNDGNGSTDCNDPACFNQQCSDGDPCTAPDRCGSGPCVGQPVVCNSPPASQCTEQDAGVCVAGSCRYAVRTGSSCDDGQLCSVGDSCLADAGCSGQPKTCTGVYDGGCSAMTGACNPADGTCQFPAAPNGTACDDLDGCTSMDRCGDAGVCRGGPVTCTAPVCQVAVGCTSGSCMVTNADAGTGCDAGFCAGGVCSAFPYVPSNFPPASIATSEWSSAVHLTGPCTVAFSSFGAGSFTNTCGLSNLPLAKQVSLSDGTLALLLPFGGLVVDAPSTLALTGDKPVILAVKGDANVTGLITASSAGNTPGAGANAAGCSAGAAGPGMTFVVTGGAMGSGGGGGAFASAGTAGGKTADGGTPGAAGMPNGLSSLVPLRGGCPGAVGGQSAVATICTPGPGGGAVQLSVAGTLTLNGRVAASGAGGAAGFSSNTAPNGRGGGGGCGAGSGGGILLEGRAVSLNGGMLLTNGGGGGEGGAFTLAGDAGVNGSTVNVTPAPGGDLGNTNGGKGGNGAAGRVATGGFVAAGPAADGLTEAGGGGGGGGVGRVRVNASSSCVGPTAVSGDITFSMTCP